MNSQAEAHPAEVRGAPALRWACPGPRTLLRLVGEDAVRFCDNFVTAAASKLPVGAGTEAFVTDAKGWVVAFVHLLRTDDGLLLDAPGDLGEKLRGHLEHYHIREKLEIVDASADAAAVVLVGRDAAGWLEPRTGVAIPEPRLAHAAMRLDGCEFRAVRIDWLGEEAILLVGRADERQKIVATLVAAGAVEVPFSVVEAARIEQGYPSTDDIPDKTLPQELGRDATAISFTKGCYLGQETVARIDALGHVNRRLVGLAVEGPVPARDSAVTVDGETVGRVGSACDSPRLGMPLALALAHVKLLAPATHVMVGGRPARVVSLPLPATDAARRVLLETRRFRVVAIEETLPDGSRRRREVVEHPGSVVILPMLDEASASPRVCLIENHRAAIGRAILELPAGTLDHDEPLEQAALRELAEETGYRAGRIEPMGRFWVSPGILRERMHLFRAESLEAGPQALEPGERIVVRVVAWSDALAMCLDGRIEDAKSIAGILMEQARRTGRDRPSAP